MLKIFCGAINLQRTLLTTFFHEKYNSDGYMKKFRNKNNSKTLFDGIPMEISECDSYFSTFIDRDFKLS